MLVAHSFNDTNGFPDKENDVCEPSFIENAASPLPVESFRAMTHLELAASASTAPGPLCEKVENDDEFRFAASLVEVR